MLWLGLLNLLKCRTYLSHHFHNCRFPTVFFDWVQPPRNISDLIKVAQFCLQKCQSLGGKRWPYLQISPLGWDFGTRYRTSLLLSCRIHLILDASCISVHTTFADLRTASDSSLTPSDICLSAFNIYSVADLLLQTWWSISVFFIFAWGQFCTVFCMKNDCNLSTTLRGSGCYSAGTTSSP